MKGGFYSQLVKIKYDGIRCLCKPRGQIPSTSCALTTSSSEELGALDSIHVVEIGFVSKLVNLEGPETDLLEAVVKVAGASSCDTRGLICPYPADTTRTHLCLDSPAEILREQYRLGHGHFISGSPHRHQVIVTQKKPL